MEQDSYLGSQEHTKPKMQLPKVCGHGNKYRPEEQQQGGNRSNQQANKDPTSNHSNKNRSYFISHYFLFLVTITTFCTRLVGKDLDTRLLDRSHCSTVLFPGAPFHSVKITASFKNIGNRCVGQPCIVSATFGHYASIGCFLTG